MFLLSLKYCRNKEEAQDNLHDVYIEIFKNIKKYKGTGSFEGWIKRITINRAIDKYKKHREIPVEFQDRDSKEILLPGDQIETIPLAQLLELIQELPNQYRLVFNLYEMDDYSHKEIAALLNISISTSKSNLHRSKQLLKSKIQLLKSHLKEPQK